MRAPEKRFNLKFKFNEIFASSGTLLTLTKFVHHSYNMATTLPGLRWQKNSTSALLSISLPIRGPKMWTITQSLTVCHATTGLTLILSRLDYCNGLLSGIPVLLMKQLEGVMRAAARLILQLLRSGHVTKAMHDRLHWLDMQARIEFKLCVTAYRCLHGLVPSYLSRLCIPVSDFPGRSHLRSATSGKLLVPSCKTKTIGPRAFAVACPTAWNNLPIELSDPANSDSLPIFKMKLETHFFMQMLTRYWLTFIFIYFLTFLMVDLCYWYVLWECSFREHVNTWIIITICTIWLLSPFEEVVNVNWNIFSSSNIEYQNN